MQRKVQILPVYSALEGVCEDCLRNGSLAEELVCNPDASSVYVGRRGVPVGAAVAQAVAQEAGKEVSKQAEICLCCGAWWLCDEASPLPSSCAWTNVS